VAKIGVIHYNLRALSFEEFLDYCVKTGFDYTELQISDVWADEIDNPEAKAEEVRKQVDARGLTVSALSSGNDFVYLAEDKVAAQVERMKRICGLARILGTHTIRTEGGQPKDEVPDAQYGAAIAGCLERCLAFAEPDDMYLAVDNHGYVTNDGDLELEIFERVNSKHVGANIDTMNYRWAGHELDTIDRWYEKVAPWCLHTHLKDGTGSGKDYVGAALGNGEIHLAKAVEALGKVDYDGVWCAEYEGKEDPVIGYAKCCEWMKANL
jgi:sugar phosphate isomerase/epimerase